jgi:hypothetical protein
MLRLSVLQYYATSIPQFCDTSEVQVFEGYSCT